MFRARSRDLFCAGGGPHVPQTRRPPIYTVFKMPLPAHSISAVTTRPVFAQTGPRVQDAATASSLKREKSKTRRRFYTRCEVEMRLNVLDLSQRSFSSRCTPILSSQVDHKIDNQDSNDGLIMNLSRIDVLSCHIVEAVSNGFRSYSKISYCVNLSQILS